MNIDTLEIVEEPVKPIGDTLVETFEPFYMYILPNITEKYFIGRNEYNRITRLKEEWKEIQEQARIKKDRVVINSSIGNMEIDDE